MNKSIKKILYIAMPIILVLIAVSVLFYVKASNFSTIRKTTTESELISYTIVDNSFISEETIDSTESNKQFQTKIILDIHNMSKYDLGYFDITVEFMEEDSDEIWSYTQEEFSFYADNKLIITQLRPYKAKAINKVYIDFLDSDEVEKVFIYPLDEYNKLYGENNIIISPTTLKVYNTLTLASTIFTVVIMFAVAMLIVVYTKPEEDELLRKVTSRPKKTTNTKETNENQIKKLSDSATQNKVATTTKTISKTTKETPHKTTSATTANKTTKKTNTTRTTTPIKNTTTKKTSGKADSKVDK